MGYGQFSSNGYGRELAKGKPSKPQKKFVFGDHANTCHVWAQQNEETRDGWSSDGRIKFEGATIFSYGSHFPMAHFTGQRFDGLRIVLTNARGYSVSTSKHQSLVRGALHGLDVVTVPVDDLKAWLDPSLKWTKGARAKLRREYHNAALERLARALRDNEAGKYWATPERDARAEYEATRAALGITAAPPANVVAWSDKRAAKFAADLAARKLRQARERVAGLAPGFEVSEGFDPSRPEAATANAWQCGDKINQISNRLREIGSARLTLGKSKRFPRLVAKASAALKAGREIKTAWEALRVAAVQHDHHRHLADLGKLAELRAWRAKPDAREPAALWNYEETARLAGLAYREGDRDLGDFLRDNVSLKKWRQEVPDTFKVETYGRATITAEEWQAGKGSAYFSGSLTPTLLRKRGDTLETSRGASCPWSHAVQAFKLAQHCRATGETFTPNGHKLRVGTYSVDRITPEGELVAGCHRLDWQEMERLAIREVPAVVKPRYPLPVAVQS